MADYIVSGSWALFLRVSRIVGVAPLQFAKHCDGYSVAVSRSYSIYSILLMGLINSTGIVGLVINLYKSDIIGNIQGAIIWLVQCVALASIVALIGSCKGARRMKTMIECMIELDKMERDVRLPSVTQSESIIKRKITLLFCFIIYFPILIFVLIGYSFLVHICGYLPIFFYIHQFVYVMKFCIELQMIHLAQKVFVTFELVNQELAGMLHTSTSGPALTKEGRHIRAVMKAYVSINDIVLKLNREDGFVMFLCVFDVTHATIIQGYYFYMAAISPRNEFSWFSHDLAFVATILTPLKMIFHIETYNRIFKEASITRVNLSKVMYHLTEVGQRISIDLQLMVKQLILNTPLFVPLGMFSMRRSNIITVFSVISTCAVYLVQINS